MGKGQWANGVGLQTWEEPDHVFFAPGRRSATWNSRAEFD